MLNADLILTLEKRGFKPCQVGAGRAVYMPDDWGEITFGPIASGRAAACNMGHPLVLKVALNTLGFAQNGVESSIGRTRFTPPAFGFPERGQTRSMAAKVLGCRASRGTSCLLMPRGRPARCNDFLEMWCVEFLTVKRCVRFGGSHDSGDNEVLGAFGRFIEENSLCATEAARLDSWAVFGGELKLCDFGLTNTLKTLSVQLS